MAGDVITKPKDSGGLGIKNLRLMNVALLMKSLWKFGEDDNPLWKQLISEKYGVEDLGWNSKPSKQAYGCSIWKGIQKFSLEFKSKCKFVVGNGERIKFLARYLDRKFTPSRSIPSCF